MKLTRFSHSCIRIESEGRTLVIDPGIWTEREAVDGADAILVTHEHSDHIDTTLLRGVDVEVVAPRGSALAHATTTTIDPNTTLEVAGFNVTAVGGRHAKVVRSQKPCVNVGYIIDDIVYHPGDALHVPAQQIDTLLVPLQASWLKTSEAIQFVSDVAPRRAYGMHEGQINEHGLAAANHWLAEECGTTYQWLPAGTTVIIAE